MKILLVSLFLPHPRAPHAGGRYVYELLRHLSQTHEVDLVTRHEEDEEPLLADLRPLCRTIHPYPYRTAAQRGTLDKLRLVGNYLGFSRFADRLSRQGGYDLVQVEWVETAFCIRRHGAPLVLDAHDVLSKPAERAVEKAQGLGRLAARVRLALVQRLELAIMGRCDRVITLSDFDREYLLRLWPAAPVTTVPIPAGLDFTDRSYERVPGTILFLASYRYRPVNVAAALWFYREVFPLVRRQVPTARFVIAGYGPPPELTTLAADPRVTVTGYVEDLERCHKEAAVFVAPILTGGGIIVKLLDALAAGTPTVATSYGNEGVGAVAGRDLLVADEPAAFAAAVVRLLTDPDHAARLGAGGQAFVRQQYGREAVMSRLDAVHTDLPGAR
jgi:glycosyltransferase involved in cell wall biosynthesis